MGFRVTPPPPQSNFLPALGTISLLKETLTGKCVCWVLGNGDRSRAMFTSLSAASLAGGA